MPDQARQRTFYANSDGLHIAYQVFGSGPPDIVIAPEGVSHVEARWDEPRLARFLSSLSEIGRVVLLDQRGVGLSDPLTGATPPTLESWRDDVVAVLDAVGAEHAVVLSLGASSLVSVVLAATRPDRVSAAHPLRRNAAR